MLSMRHKAPGQVIEHAYQMQHAACPMQIEHAKISNVMLNHGHSMRHDMRPPKMRWNMNADNLGGHAVVDSATVILAM